MKKQNEYMCAWRRAKGVQLHEEQQTWLGNPDDHEPTSQVTRENINP